MNKVLLLATLIISNFSMSQIPEDFNVEIEPVVIPSVPGIHSYSWGLTSDEKWVVLGGRIDGLHQRQPFAAFLDQDNNKNVFVIDPIGEQVWSSSITGLSTSLYEQLESTNQQFFQRDSILYITGGYGYSASTGGHITYPNLTAVNLNQLADSVMTSGTIDPAFRQINDPYFKVTGGQLGYLDSTFYLVGGHLFDGSYNPMGPDHGPGFTQIYTNDIRTFKLEDDGVNLTPSDMIATHDTVNLHRRDYNLAPQIFPTGDKGFTAFSGVFNYLDMPYLNVVDITPGNYTVNNTFNQYLSQYHSAKMPVYDTISNVMHTVFFGGMSQFTLDNQNNLIEDVDVPFVKTISKVSRFDDGSMQEADLNYIEMPTLVGSGAEFIPTGNYWYDFDILDLNAIPQQKTLVGYIYGGIESTAENIFFINDGTQSSASNVIFKVYINKSTVSQEEVILNGQKIVDLRLYPNPVRKKLNIEFFAASMDQIQIDVTGLNGRTVKQIVFEPQEIGTQELKINVSDIPTGSYFIVVNNGAYQDQKQFVKK